jgi:hypothetical protein
MHQGATPFFERPVTTGDPEAFVHGVRPSSVSNLSAQPPRFAMRSLVWPSQPRLLSWGNVVQSMGVGGHRMAAALASHGRSRWFEPNHAHGSGATWSCAFQAGRRAMWSRSVPGTPFSSTGPISVNVTDPPSAASTTSWLTSTSPGLAYSAILAARFTVRPK